MKFEGAPCVDVSSGVIIHYADLTQVIPIDHNYRTTPRPRGLRTLFSCSFTTCLAECMCACFTPCVCVHGVQTVCSLCRYTQVRNRVQQ